VVSQEMASDDDSLAYYSIKNPRLYHLCANCNVGRNIVPDARKVVRVHEAKRLKLRMCRRCFVIRGADNTCESVTR
jgi:hypothetical protein